MYTLDTVPASIERSANSGRIVLSKTVINAIRSIGKYAGRDSMSVGDVVYVINKPLTRADEKVTEQQVEREMKRIAADYAKGMHYMALSKRKTFSSLDGYFFQYK